MHMLRGGHSSTLATSTTVITQFVSAAEIIMGYLFGHRPVYKYQLIGYSASRGYYYTDRFTSTRVPGIKKVPSKWQWYPAITYTTYRTRVLCHCCSI